MFLAAGSIQGGAYSVVVPVAGLGDFQSVSVRQDGTDGLNIWEYGVAYPDGLLYTWAVHDPNLWHDDGVPLGVAAADAIVLPHVHSLHYPVLAGVGNDVCSPAPSAQCTVATLPEQGVRTSVSIFMALTTAMTSPFRTA